MRQYIGKLQVIEDQSYTLVITHELETSFGPAIVGWLQSGDIFSALVRTHNSSYIETKYFQLQKKVVFHNVLYFIAEPIELKVEE